MLRDQSTPLRTEVAPKLSDVLFSSRAAGFDTFAVLPSNVAAVESSLLFANGLQTFVALVGPTGWGKSHLLEASMAHMLGRDRRAGWEIVSAVDWVSRVRPKMSSSPMVLDNVQDVLGRTRLRLQLRIMLERRVRAGWPTLLAFTAARATRSMRNLLPWAREWQMACVETPSPTERAIVLQRMAQTEGLVLADSLTRVLSHRLDATGHSYLGALKRLKLLQSRWLDSCSVLRALGVLSPYFVSDADWDLRDEVAAAIGELRAEDFSEESRASLAVYVMHRLAMINEAEVAEFMGMAPGQVYSRTAGFEKRMRSCAATAAAANRLVERLVDRMSA
ncbi:MAG: hypothetical protein SNJ76_08610 [Fimbriimonadaceae bacterium]